MHYVLLLGLTAVEKD